jgi:hypothetical protein
MHIKVGAKTKPCPYKLSNSQQLVVCTVLIKEFVPERGGEGESGGDRKQERNEGEGEEGQGKEGDRGKEGDKSGDSKGGKTLPKVGETVILNDGREVVVRKVYPSGDIEI